MYSYKFVNVRELTPRGRGGEGYSIKISVYGEDPPGGSNPYPLIYYTNFYQTGTPFVYLEQNCTPSCTSRISKNNRISCNCHVFPGFSVVLKVQAICSYFCQNVAPFDIHRFSHFAADFITLSYTKMAIFPTLLYKV